MPVSEVVIVGAGPGRPDFLTVAGDRAIRQAQVLVYAGSLVHPDVVALAPADCARHDSASMDLEAIVAVMVEGARAGRRVVRLHCGDPAIYGAIAEQTLALEAAGVPYRVIPGVSSFLASAAALGAELTLPEVSQTVILTRGEGRTPVPDRERLAGLAAHQATLCVFLSTQLLRQVRHDLIPAYGADCPCAMVYHAGWEDQKVVRATLEDVADKAAAAGLTKTAMLIVGRALARQGAKSRLYDAGFSHEYRKAGGA